MDVIWNTVIINPMVNAMLWLYGLLGHSYVLALLVFTLLTRLITWPLTIQQQKSSAAMTDMQPKLNALKEKYKNDQEKLSREQMALYREAGVNPLGGCLPLLVQFPILIGLYQALNQSLAAAPLDLMRLSQHIIPHSKLPEFLAWLPDATALLPLNNKFGWLNLASPDPLYILPVVVVLTTWLQNKLLTPASADPQQRAMGQTMQFTMPLMIGFFSLNFPSGLSIYWTVANIIGIGQYTAMGKAGLKNLFGTPDGSFSWRGLIGLPPAEPESERKGKSRPRAKKK